MNNVHKDIEVCVLPTARTLGLTLCVSYSLTCTAILSAALFSECHKSVRHHSLRHRRTSSSTSRRSDMFVLCM